MKIVAVINQKGGVGKTTVACHLAYAAAGFGKRVLAVDVDTQRNLTHTLAGGVDFGPETSASQLFTLKLPADLQVVTGLRPGIDVLNATTLLDQLDHEFTLADAVSRSSFIRSLPWDLVIFDTPPALGLRHLSPLVWADLVVVPVEPSPYSIDGVTETLKAIRKAQDVNPRLRYSIIVNKHDRSSATHLRITEALSKIVDLPHILTTRVGVTNALSEGVPVWEFKPAPPALRQAWLEMCQELTSL